MSSTWINLQMHSTDYANWAFQECFVNIFNMLGMIFGWFFPSKVHSIESLHLSCMLWICRVFASWYLYTHLKVPIKSWMSLGNLYVDLVFFLSGWWYLPESDTARRCPWNHSACRNTKHSVDCACCRSSRASPNMVSLSFSF